MEVIDLTGYTTAEKIHIAKNHLIPKQLKEHGLTPAQIQISDDALMRLISSYTREAGVRELQRSAGPIAGLLPAALSALESRTLKRIEADLAKLIDVLKPGVKAARVALPEP